MKAFKVIYKHGHFIDTENNQRLIPVQGAEYTITANDNAFKTEDEKLEIDKALNSNEKAAWAEKIYGKNSYAKIMNVDEQLFFRVGNSKKIVGDEDRQYVFVCTLLEDLYLYLLKGETGSDPRHWRLAECKCILENCLLGGLTLTEKVPAKSLNELFSKTVQFYFSLQRSGSTNAFSTFYKYEKDMKITFVDATYNHNYFALSDIRKEFVRKSNNPSK